MSFGFQTYRVQPTSRRPLRDFIVDALKIAGCRIISVSAADTAPFVISWETPLGERMGVVAYAFLATRTPTRNRPMDERSFQIKYGSKQQDNNHVLWQDPFGLYTTVLLGIDPADGFFVAADPLLHSPTKFFIRLEFKDEHAEAILRDKWHAWERDRRSSADSHPIETLVGGTQESFLDFVRFERAAWRLPPGDRQLLAERRDAFAGPIRDASVASTALEIPAAVLHPIAQEFQLTPVEILELIAGARRLKMAVRGWVAEQHLVERLLAIPDVTHCERSDDEGGPDVRVRYRGGPLLTIECKNVLRKRDKDGNPRIDFQRTRASKGDPCSRYYSPKDFDLVAGCLHAVTENWEYRFALTGSLPPHKKCEGKLTYDVRITSSWASNVTDALELAYRSGLGAKS